MFRWSPVSTPVSSGLIRAKTPIRCTPGGTKTRRRRFGKILLCGKSSTDADRRGKSKGEREGERDRGKVVVEWTKDEERRTTMTRGKDRQEKARETERCQETIVSRCNISTASRYGLQRASRGALTTGQVWTLWPPTILPFGGRA